MLHWQVLSSQDGPRADDGLHFPLERSAAGHQKALKHIQKSRYICNCLSFFTISYLNGSNSITTLGQVAHLLLSRFSPAFVTRTFEFLWQKMDPRRTDQQSPQATCLPIQDQEQEPVFMQRMGEQAPSSPPQQIRDSTAGAERAGTDRHDTHRVSWIQLPEDHHAPESDSNITAPSPCSPAWPQPVTTLEQAQQPPSRTPSVHTRSDHSDLSAAVTPTPSDPTLVSSNSTLQCPPPLRISESLGLEGCAGIIGGFVGILGVIGFLTFLWFGGKPQILFTLDL